MHLFYYYLVGQVDYVKSYLPSWMVAISVYCCLVFTKMSVICWMGSTCRTTQWIWAPLPKQKKTCMEDQVWKNTWQQTSWWTWRQEKEEQNGIRDTWTSFLDWTGDESSTCSSPARFSPGWCWRGGASRILSWKIRPSPESNYKLSFSSHKWQAPLYICFIDFKNAYEMVDRTPIRSILRNNGMQQKLINRIQSFCMNICIICSQERCQARVSPVADNLLSCDWLGDEDNHGSTKGNAVDPHPEAERFTFHCPLWGSFVLHHGLQSHTSLVKNKYT